MCLCVVSPSLSIHYHYVTAHLLGACTVYTILAQCYPSVWVPCHSHPKCMDALSFLPKVYGQPSVNLCHCLYLIVSERHLSYFH